MASNLPNAPGSRPGVSTALVSAVPPGPVSHRGGAPGNRGGLDAPGLLRAFGRRWILAVLLGLLLGGSGAAAVLVFLPPPPGTATALLHIDAVPKNLAFSMEERSSDFRIFQNTQMALAKSRLVLNTALRSPKVPGTGWYREVSAAGDQLDWLEQHLKVAFSGAEIMELSVTDVKHTDDLVVLVDAITMAYLDEIVEKDNKRRHKRYEQLREIAQRFENKIKDIRKSLRQLQEEIGPGDKNILAIRQDTARTEYDQAKSELARLRGELRGLRLQVEGVDKGLPAEAVVPPASVMAVVEKDTLLHQYEERKRKLEEQIEVMRSRAVQGDEDPALLRPLAELIKVKEAVEKRRKQLAADAEAQLKAETTKDVHSRQVLARQRLEYLQELEKLLDKDAQRLGKDARAIVGKTLDLLEFQREVDEKEELLRAIQKQAGALEVELDAPARVKLIQEGAVLRRPNEQVRKIMASSGAGFALFALAIFGVSFIEWRSRRLDSSMEVQQLGMSVIGTVPVYYAAATAEREAVGYRERRLVDSVDAARTLLLHIAEADEVKVVMVVSAVSGEGKTSLSAQLAASLARSGRRTLLIDADLRKPAIHALFHLEVSPGLSNVLRGEVPTSQAIQPTGVANMFLLAAGTPDDQALQALALEGLASLFATVRQEYDFVLVDSSPVLPVPDALMVARHVDGVLFSIMQRVSRLPRVQAACERLAMVGARILGAVVNGSRGDESYGYLYSAGTSTGPTR